MSSAHHPKSYLAIKKMVNEKGRPKKYPERNETSYSIYISEPFKETWKKLKKLALVDQDENFKKYCKQIEGQDIDEKSEGKFNLYIRWILTTHLIKNLNKLNK